MKRLIGLALGLLLAACSPSSPAPTGIGPSGGTATSADGKASLEVPAGAYSTNTNLNFSAVSNPVAAPSGKALVPGTAFNLSGTDPSTPITLKLKYDPTQVSGLGVKSQAALSSLTIYHLVNNIWQALNSNVDQKAQIVSAMISQLGTYVLLADATPTSGGTLSSIVLSCNPASIAVAATSNCTAVGKDSSGNALSTQPAFSYASSDPSKASIGATSGVATGVAVGSTNITASAGGVTSNTIALSVTAAGGGTTGSFTATVIPKPAGLVAAFPLAFNNAGTVALAGSSSLTAIDSIHIYNGTSSTPLAMPSGLSIALNGLTAKACINATGQLAFSAMKAGKNQPAFYNGSSVVEVGFGLTNPSGMTIKGCNDSGAILGDGVSGGSAKVWQDGATTSIPGFGFGIAGLDISNTGTVISGFGYVKAGKYTDFTNNASFIGNKINDSDIVAGFQLVSVGGSNVKKIYTYNIATAAITELATSPSVDLNIIDFNNKGQVLLGYQETTVLIEGSKVTNVVVSGINQGSAVAINDNGWILIRDSNGTNAGYILKPQ